MSITNMREAIEKAREHAKSDPKFAASLLLDYQELEDAGFYGIVAKLASSGCTENEINYVMDNLEKYLVEKG